MNLRINSLEQILATAEGKSLHRSLGAFQLMMLGVGAIIGTGIFVLTAEAAQKSGPAMMISFDSVLVLLLAKWCRFCLSRCDGCVRNGRGTSARRWLAVSQPAISNDVPEVGVGGGGTDDECCFHLQTQERGLAGSAAGVYDDVVEGLAKVSMLQRNSGDR